jgi:hypothetical protein
MAFVSLAESGLNTIIFQFLQETGQGMERNCHSKAQKASSF